MSLLLVAPLVSLYLLAPSLTNVIRSRVFEAFLFGLCAMVCVLLAILTWQLFEEPDMHTVEWRATEENSTNSIDGRSPLVWEELAHTKKALDPKQLVSKIVWPLFALTHHIFFPLVEVHPIFQPAVNGYWRSENSKKYEHRDRITRSTLNHQPLSSIGRLSGVAVSFHHLNP